jgi:hypothetical protein
MTETERMLAWSAGRRREREQLASARWLLLLMTISATLVINAINWMVR